MYKACILLCATLTGACLGLEPSVSIGGPLDAPLDPACQQYDDAYIAWTAVASVASGLSGAAGAALAVWPDPTRDEQIAVGTTGLVLGVVGTTAGLLSGMYAQRWAERCSGGR